MTVTTTQNVIKIGTSSGVIIPARDLKRAGVKLGEKINLRFEAAEKVDPEKVELVALTQNLIARHKKALENLSQR
jgi:antitoxin component of MazEF toxin-antitoxin module